MGSRYLTSLIVKMAAYIAISAFRPRCWSGRKGVGKGVGAVFDAEERYGVPGKQNLSSWNRERFSDINMYKLMDMNECNS